MKLARAVLMVVGVVVAGVPALAQEPFVPALRARVDKEIDKQKIVGLCIAIGRDGKIIAAESFGFEDREAKIAASEQTMFRWASVSKPLTAVVTMQLSHEGKLDLDADIRTLVPEFPEKRWPITSRQLLCHQGGIVHYGNGKVIKTERTYEVENPFKDTILALDHFKESPLVNEPGTAFSYTTHGYMLLGAVAQRAGGEPYAELVRKRIAEPCGMTTLRPDYQWESIPHRAVGYHLEPSGVVEIAGNSDVSWKLPGGGFISTATDMAKFGVGMLTGKLVDEKIRTQMWTNQKTRDGKEIDYGLGFRIDDLEGRRYIEHSGAQQKTATHLVIYPARGVCVAVMSNSEQVRLGELARDLVKIALGEPVVEKKPEEKKE